MIPKAIAVTTTKETKAIEAVVSPSATRTIVMTGGAVILTPTANATTRRPCNVSIRTACMAPMSGKGTSTSWPTDNPTCSPLDLAGVKVVEEENTKVDAALVTVEAVDEVVVDIRAVSAFRAVDAATVAATTVDVAKATTMETSARTMAEPHKSRTIKATVAAMGSMRTRLPYSPDNKVA